MDKRLKMPNHVAKFDLTYLLNTGDIAQNTIYLRRSDCTGGGGLTWDDTAADGQGHSLGAAWAGTLGHVISQDATLESVAWCWNENVDTGPLHEGIAAGGGFPYLPSVLQPAFPAGCAKAIRMQTGLGGRSHHGRIFLPAVPQTFGTTDKADQLTGAAITAYNTQAAAFLAAANNNDCVAGVGSVYSVVVESFISAGALRAIAIDTEVTAMNIFDGFVDYQRRRSLGHSRHH